MPTDYYQYIQSSAWRTNPVRLREFEAAGFRCRLCAEGDGSGLGLEAHHRTYERFGREVDGDLVALCGDCHKHVTSFLRARRYARSVPLRADVDIDDRRKAFGHAAVADGRS